MRGTIFEWPRNHGPKIWQKLANCTLCVGQWIGMACALIFLQPAELSLQYAVIILGIGSVVAVLAHGIYQVIDTLVAVELWKR